MQVNRLSCTTHTNPWWLVAAIAAIVIGAVHSDAVAAVGDGPEPATNPQQGLDVAIVVGIPAQAGDITATAMRRIGVDVFAALEPGDKITIAAARGSGRPIEILSIIRRAEDVGAAGAATVARAWREKADPLAGRSADVAAGLAELLAGRGDASIDLLVVVPAARVGSAGASSIWASAKRARDNGAVVWLIGPPDSDLQDAAKTGVLNWTPVDAATPAACAAWVAQARRNQGGGPTVVELQGEIEKVRGELAALRAQGEKERAAGANEIAARDARIKTLERELEEAIARRRTAEAEAEAARGLARTQEQVAGEAQRRIEVAEARAQSLGVQVEQANEARTRADQIATDLRTAHDAERLDWERQIKAAEAEAESLRSANTSLQADNDRLSLQSAVTPSVPPEEFIAAPEVVVESTDAGTPKGRQQSDASSTSVRPEGLAIAVAAGLGLIIVVAIGRAVIVRQSKPRVVTLRCRTSTSDAWTPVEVGLRGHEAIVVSPERPIAVEAIDKIDGAAHLIVRGEDLELHDGRPGSALHVNDAPVGGVRVRVRLGDRVQVRHPDGRTTSLIVSAIKKSSRARPPAPVADAPIASPA